MALAAGPAGVKLDGTLGGSATTLAGPTYNITQNLGRLSGGNLFFSFQYFNVATHETALFTTTSPGIDNVISRVTGGYATNVDGTIRLAAASGDPNFYFINPAGVTFTANAAIDVPAAFAVTTANYLKFGDGNFYADPGKASTLSALAPEAFGFLGTTRAAVNVLGANLSAGVNGAGDFQIAAGDVTIDGEGGQMVAGLLEPTGIQTTSGNIRVTAVGSANTEVPIIGPFASTDGTVTIRNGGALVTVGAGPVNGGAIEVNAGDLLIDGSGLPLINSFQAGLVTSTDIAGLGTNSSGPITVAVAHAARIVNGGEIESQTFGAGYSGDVTLTAEGLTIDGQNFSTEDTGIFSSTFSSGAAGNLTMNVNSASIRNGGYIGSQSYGAGNAGNISLNAGNLAMDSGTTAPYFGGGTGIEDVPLSSGAGGNITLNVSGSISMLNFAEIYANADGTTGSAGRVLVNAGSLSMNGGTYNLAGGIFAGSYYLDVSPYGVSSGSGGDVVINVAGNVAIANGMQISSGTLGSANSGNISLSAGSLNIYRSGTYTPLPADAPFFFVPFTGLTAVTYGSGSAGQINLKLGSLSISGGNPNYFVGIRASAGDVTEGADFGLPPSTGPGGSIVANVSGNVDLQDGGQISTSTYGAGPAGSVSLTAKNLAIGGGSNASGIFSAASAGSSGQTGQLTIDTGSLAVTSNGFIDISNAATVANPKLVVPTRIKLGAEEIDMDGGGITADSTGNVAASDIDISYHQSLNMDSSAISTTSNHGDGGPITVTGQGALWLENSSITTSALGTTNGNGGDIRVTVPYVVLDSGVIQANTAAPKATGGNVVISAYALIPSFESYVLGGRIVAFNPTILGQNVVQAAAPDGLSGTLDVTVPTLDLGSVMLGLTGAPSTPMALSRSLCAYRSGSSLSVAGRGGLPVSYRDPLWIDPGEPMDAAPAGPPRTTGRSVSDSTFQGFALIACR